MKYLNEVSRRPAFAATVSVTTLLIGCGVHNTLVPAAFSQPPVLTGAWLFTGVGSQAVMAAGLSTNAGGLNGLATAYGCNSTPEQTFVSGTITSTGEVSLDTAKLSDGASLHIKGRLNADRQSIDGTLNAIGDTCSSETTLGGIKGHVYAPAQGSYTGVFTGSDGASTPVVAVLSQSAVPELGGSYRLNGSVAFSNSFCLDTAAINSTESTVTGGALLATYTATVSGQQVTVTATGTADPGAVNIAITGWTIRGGPCDGYSGTGVLTLR